jgi:hypothetical protein
MSTQTPAHSVLPAGQRQTPAEHAKPAGQLRPQPPQCSTSLVVSTQLPAQSRVLAGQVAPLQLPALQTSSPAHTRPHAPQLAGSICGLTQPLPHEIRPGKQLH